MRAFLSEEAIGCHKEYLNTLRLRYSILEKSETALKCRNMHEISRQNIPRDLKNDALTLLSEITLHEIFFDSFSQNGGEYSARAASQFGSVGGLLNRLYSLALSADGGFLTVISHAGRLRTELVTVKSFAAHPSVPTLALDLCEHCYFPDYRFDKRAYLLAALPRLKLSRLD